MSRTGEIDVDDTLKWKGSKEIVIRKKQIPSLNFSPKEVVQICLDALQLNDDPQLDHGCCVLLAFNLLGMNSHREISVTPQNSVEL